MTPKQQASKIRKDILKIIWDSGCNVNKKLVNDLSILQVYKISKELEITYNGEPITTNKHKIYWNDVLTELKKDLYKTK